MLLDEMTIISSEEDDVIQIVVDAKNLWIGKLFNFKQNELQIKSSKKNSLSRASEENLSL